MTTFVVRLPDVGEGVAEAELVAWHVVVGQTVTSATIVADVLTDKATVEIYAPVEGTVTTLFGQAGDVLAVGSDFFAIEIYDSDDEADSTVTESAPAVTPAVTPESELRSRPDLEPDRAPSNTDAAPTAEAASSAQQALAAPAVRERARTLGVDLTAVVGSGPGGRVTHADLDGRMQTSSAAPRELRPPSSSGVTKVALIGLRRKIAARMTTSSSQIPHITYVDEIDMTQVESLRHALIAAYPDQRRLTVLPFVMRAIVVSVADHSELNATFDDETQTLTVYDQVHIGIATQTPNGLIVPVVRDAQLLDLWGSADEMERVTTAARNGTAVRDELTGSTITITSLGALGGIMTTPIINYPEVAIVGINKMQQRPLWDGTAFVPRLMMNMSSSFDHRIIDGWLAATFVQRIKTLLEEPSLLFVPRP